MTFLTSQGELVDVDYLRWFEWRFQGGAALSMQGLGSFENPRRYLVQAAAPVTGTLIVRVGQVRGCDDPPECLIKHWEQELTDLVIPFQVQPAAARRS